MTAWPADQVERWPIERLIPYARNARTHTDEQVALIAASIREWGWTTPVLVDETGNLIAGHGRVLAARQLGLAEIPTMTARGWSDAQIRAYRIADNQLAQRAGWDDELLHLELSDLRRTDYNLDLIGFADRELAELLADRTEGLTDPDEAPPLPEEPVSRAGDLWRLGRHRLLCDDSTAMENIVAVMAGQRADAVFTSPPYAVGVDYDEYDDTIENLRLLLPECAKRWIDVVVPGGFAVVNFSDVFSGQSLADSKEPCEYPMAIEHYPVFRREGWALWSRRVWCKPVATCSSRHCINSNRAASNYEHIWTWKRPGRPPIVAQIAGEYQSQVGWFDTTEHPEIGRETHGAVMITGVARRMITIHCRAGAVVFEPFSGSGTTIIAAEMTGRACHAIEISPAYVDVAVKRWQTFTGQQATRESDGVAFDEVAAKTAAEGAERP